SWARPCARHRAALWHKPSTDPPSRITFSIRHWRRAFRKVPGHRLSQSARSTQWAHSQWLTECSLMVVPWSMLAHTQPNPRPRLQRSLKRPAEETACGRGGEYCGHVALVLHLSLGSQAIDRLFNNQ